MLKIICVCTGSNAKRTGPATPAELRESQDKPSRYLRIRKLCLKGCGICSVLNSESSWDQRYRDAFRTITATLKQTGDLPATVKVHNLARLPQMQELAALVFAVLLMTAALGGTTDALDFVLEIEGKEVFLMRWKDGLKARAQLRKCERRR